MSGIKIYVRNEREKVKLIEDYLAPDNKYLHALDVLKEELRHQGVDLGTKEGKKQFIMAVKKLNALFGKDLHTKDFVLSTTSSEPSDIP